VILPVSFSEEIRLFDLPAHSTDDLLVIFAFPNTYELGITSLGYQVVWKILATCPGVQVTRLFTDCHEPLPKHPDLFGFSFSWELDYGNILTLLESQRIPIWASERSDDHPLVFGGGPVFTANPEPFAPFFDFFLLGDGEELLIEVQNALREVRSADRYTKLKYLAEIAGVYVPSFYPVEYLDHDSRLDMTPLTRRTWRGETLSASSVVTEHSAWPGIYMVEVVRSCPEMCRFCLASYLTLPFRVPDVETTLIPLIEKGLKVTDRLGLLGASITQHPQFEALIDYLAAPERSQVRVSVSSVRTNTLTPKLCETLVARGSQSVTIAIESGSERLRQIINKKLSNAEISDAAHVAVTSGLHGLKLYGMCGVPGEIDSDLDETIALLLQLKKQHRSLRLSFGCSTFVPKAQTPFQRYGVSTSAEKKLQKLQKQLRPHGIEFRPESYNWSVIQALISRGDRRVAQVLERARHYGQTLGSFRRAFKDFKGELPPLDYYVHANWDERTRLPWQHLLSENSSEMLEKHQVHAQKVMAL
jgi:radical SAM superfamily enzyme YgiQ (UPF0313 family)